MDRQTAQAIVPGHGQMARRMDGLTEATLTGAAQQGAGDREAAHGPIDARLRGASACDDVDGGFAAFKETEKEVT